MGELASTSVALQTASQTVSLTIITDSQYTIKTSTRSLPDFENASWTNAPRMQRPNDGTDMVARKAFLTVLSSPIARTHPGHAPGRPDTKQRPSRLLRILMSESMYLIWILRCERVVQKAQHSLPVILRQGGETKSINESKSIDTTWQTSIKAKTSHGQQ